MANIDMDNINLNPNDNMQDFEKGCELAEKELDKLIEKYKKKSAEKHQKMFEQKNSVLNKYGSKEEINEMWAYDYITTAERDRLFAIWDSVESQPVPEDFVLNFLVRCKRDLLDYKYYEPKAYQKRN